MSGDFTILNEATTAKDKQTVATFLFLRDLLALDVRYELSLSFEKRKKGNNYFSSSLC